MTGLTKWNTRHSRLNALMSVPTSFGSTLLHGLGLPMWLALVSKTVSTWYNQRLETMLVYFYTISAGPPLLWGQTCTSLPEDKRPQKAELSCSSWDHPRLTSLQALHQLNVDAWELRQVSHAWPRHRTA